MSTRATYQIDGRTFYIHHDGYLEGAAHYFREALLHPNRRGGLAERFLRANEGAEFTICHETHEDTEFRYTLIGDFLRVSKRSGDWSAPEWHGVVVGSLLDFVNRRSGDAQVILARGMHYTPDTLAAAIGSQLDQAEHAAAQGWTGNSSHYTSEAWALLLAYEAATKTELTDGRARIDALDAKHVAAYGWPGTDEERLAKWRETFRKSA
jgi:hypothetical protein